MALSCASTTCQSLEKSELRISTQIGADGSNFQYTCTVIKNLKIESLHMNNICWRYTNSAEKLVEKEKTDQAEYYDSQVYIDQ